MLAEKSKNKVNVMLFDSLEELMTDLLNIPPDKRYTIEPHNWTGRSFSNWEEIKDALHEMWNEGMWEYDKMLQELRQERIQPPTSIKRQAVWSEEEGDEFSYERYKTGQAPLRTTKRTRRHALQQVNIIANISMSCGEESFSLLWRAAASVCLASLLEEAGYRTEIWGVYHGANAYNEEGRQPTGGGFEDKLLRHLGIGNNVDVLVGVELKRFEDPFDPGSLVNALSGWAFRTVWLAALHLWEEKGTTIAYGYGRPTALGDERVKELTHDPQVLKCEKVLSKAQALDWVKTEIKKMEGDKHA